MCVFLSKDLFNDCFTIDSNWNDVHKEDFIPSGNEEWMHSWLSIQMKSIKKYHRQSDAAK